MIPQAIKDKDRGVDAAECVVVPIAAPNDRNGNARRCYLVTHYASGYVAAVDEGCHGVQAIDVELGRQIGAVLRARISGALAVAPKTYRDAIKRYGFHGSERRAIFLRTSNTPPEAKGRASSLPAGWHEQADGALVCPHRDVSVCDGCAAAHEEVVDVLGAHFWIADASQREEVRSSCAAPTTGPTPAHGEEQSWDPSRS